MHTRRHAGNRLADLPRPAHPARRILINLLVGGATSHPPVRLLPPVHWRCVHPLRPRAPLSGWILRRVRPLSPRFSLGPRALLSPRAPFSRQAGRRVHLRVRRQQGAYPAEHGGAHHRFL
eukprot:scaffold17170_cov62-Phaeocystis_antarctica.AAC.1